MSQTKTVAQWLASFMQARINCENATPRNSEWFATHSQRIQDLVKEHMPSGSGIDTGTSFDFDKSTPRQLTFSCGFHHMNEGGVYDGWTEHLVIVTPEFEGVGIKITGRDRNGIKEYLADVYLNALAERLTHDSEGFTRAPV